MSDLQRAWAKSRLVSVSPDAFDEREEQDSYVADLPEIPIEDDSSSASSASSTGTIIPSPSRNLFARPEGLPRGRALTQIPWTTYFERELFLEPTGDDAPGSPTLHAYLTSPVGKGPLFVMHHGAGSSGLSFAVVGAEIRKRLPSAGILSHDARGHGETVTRAANTTTTAAAAAAAAATTTTTSSSSSSSSSTSTPSPLEGAARDGSESSGGGAAEPPLDLSLQTLADDLLAVITRTRAAMRWSDLPPIILVGHSLGGAVVTELARSGRLGAATLLGYAVLDVVEGSAMDALQSMQTYLSTRPTGFASLETGIEWHVRSRTIRNAISARVSVPALLRHHGPTPGPKAQEGGRAGSGSSGTPRPWRWRTDLASTQPFWENWFVGLSKKFLEAKGGKLLLLAGTDRLDTELTIGQMQGKYNLQVFPEAGHFIHEDLPEKTAISLVDFHKRNDRSALVLPPKVSDLLKQGKKV